MKYQIRKQPGAVDERLTFFAVYSEDPQGGWRYRSSFLTHTDARQFVVDLPAVPPSPEVVEEIER